MDRRPRSLYGRRRGRKLRPGRQALMARRLPELSVALPREEGAALDPAVLFPEPVSDVWLEIGFGAGEHLAWQARNNPEVGIIGCEPYVNGVASLLRYVDHEGLSNVRIFADDSRLLVSRLPAGSIGRLFILFPDPWPKLRHHKRRIIGPQNLEQYARVLKDGAELRLATDHGEYGRWMLLRLRGCPHFRWSARQARDWRERPEDWPETRYEAKAIGEGRRAIFLRYVRRPRAKEAGEFGERP